MQPGPDEWEDYASDSEAMADLAESVVWTDGEGEVTPDPQSDEDAAIEDAEDN